MIVNCLSIFEQKNLRNKKCQNLLYIKSKIRRLFLYN